MKMKTLITLCVFCIATNVMAATYKIGVLAPEGTAWAKSLKKMVDDVDKATNGEVKIKIYFGGSQGDEPDVLRKIRIGQLHGGIFTGKTLGDINGDVRVMELPFTFYHDREKALQTMKNLTPFFNKGFEKNKFANLGFFELGVVYFVSQKKTDTLSSLKGMKIWSWEGDQLVEAMIKQMDLVSVPLPLPDVLSSLTTGIIEAAYAPPLGIVALQWNTKIKYLVDFPISYSTGAFLMAKDSWNKIPANYQAKINEISQKCVDEINIGNTRDNGEALAAMKAMGVEFLTFSKEDVKTAEGLRKKIVASLKGSLFSEEALKKLEAEVKSSASAKAK